MAIRAGVSDLVRFHLRRSDHVNQQDDSGTSLLMYAASQGHAEICRILLEAGADPLLKNRQGQGVGAGLFGRSPCRGNDASGSGRQIGRLRRI
jgi:ankyrin repeat protein